MASQSETGEGGHGMIRRLRLAAVLCALVLAVVACGNRLPHDEIVAASSAGGGTTGFTTGGGTTGGATTGGTTTGGTTGGATGGIGGTTGTTGGAFGGTTGTAAGGTKSPIIIGTVGNLSGIPGGVTVPGLRGLQAWVGATNAKGGIDGHPIKLLVADDQSDPTRHKAAMQDMVERQKAIAFVGIMAPLTDGAGREYIESKRVPVIGGGNVSGVWFQSPMYFAHTGTARDILFGNFKVAKRFGEGRTKVATITCVEGAACSDFKRDAPPVAREAGLEVVYQVDVSLAQPDFTAECLNANNRGAQILLPVGDQNLVHRVATSCARQGYRPMIIHTTPSENETKFAAVDGAVAGQGFFPFPGVSGTFTDEYRAAMKKYFPKQELTTLSPAGWAAGKIFEKVATMALQRADTLTSSAILEALWTFRSETLGGMILPVTYTRNKPSIVAPCWFTIRLKDGKWLTPDGVTRSCR